MKFVAISDTHNLYPTLPKGDVLIHAGDMCSLGLESEFVYGINWLADQPHKYKIYVPGNHDRFPFDFYEAANNLCKDRRIAMLANAPMTMAPQLYDSGLPTICGSPNTRIFGKTRTASRYLR